MRGGGKEGEKKKGRKMREGKAPLPIDSLRLQDTFLPRLSLVSLTQHFLFQPLWSSLFATKPFWAISFAWKVLSEPS